MCVGVYQARVDSSDPERQTVEKMGRREAHIKQVSRLNREDLQDTSGCRPALRSRCRKWRSVRRSCRGVPKAGSRRESLLLVVSPHQLATFHLCLLVAGVWNMVTTNGLPLSAQKKVFAFRGPSWHLESLTDKGCVVPSYCIYQGGGGCLFW